MRIQEAMKNIMKERKITQQRIAYSLNTTQSSVNDRLNRGNISLESSLKILNVLGYEMVIQPKSSGRRKDGQIVIDE
jgi:DNA-binding helix-turn-helix protein